jgi:formylglycine-generating enzyme required for sulfatase activity
MLASQTILQNRYRIMRELGRGGMGAVYEAIDQRLTSKVALKEMLGARDIHARNAFEREAALLANLNHPNLPRVTDHFSENDGAYLVMQFIEGMDLAEWLDLRGSPFPQAQVLQWADTLLEVLEYLHGNNPPILHRDIKPSNIKRTEDGRIYLLDFGLAKGSLGQMPTYGTTPSMRGGTHYYSPLEQFSGLGTDARSDLYALGATLYHLISGVPPADAGSRHQAIEDEEPDPLLPLADFTSASVATVIERALNPSRKQRFVSATEMRRALRHAAEEDERSSLKDEYRRAEERRRQRDEERKKASEEAARRAEEDRRLQEAETRKKEALEQQKAAALRQQELERKRREDAERRHREAEIEAARLRAEEIAREERADTPSTVVPPVLPNKSAESSGHLPTPRPVISTIPSPPPERPHTDQDNAVVTREKTSRAARPRAKRAIAIAAAFVVLIGVIGAIFLWSQPRTVRPDKSASSQTQEGTMPQLNLNGNQSAPESKPPEGMVYVPGGAFMMGRNDGDEYERPAHQVTVKAFFIDRFEVTNDDYAKFIKVTNRVAPPGWPNGSYPADAQRKPVTGVTWNDAVAYAQWAGKRLPTEEEWEFTARGGEKEFQYPWGNGWRRGMANADGARNNMAEIGAYRGSSPFGAFDMVGNAWEWTSTDMAPYVGGNLPEQPAANTKVLRGGSFKSSKDQATATYRFGWRASEEASYAETGFRCVKDMTGGVTQK